VVAHTSSLGPWSAFLDPLTTSVSLHAFGSTCLYYASFSTVVAFVSFCKTARDQRPAPTREPGDVLRYPSTDSPDLISETPVVPPEDTETAVPVDPQVATAEKWRFLKQFLNWPNRAGGIWHSSVKSLNKIRRANLPPGQTKRKPQRKSPPVDAEAWANDVMSHFFVSPEAEPPAWDLYVRESDVGMPSAGQFPLSPLDILNLSRESIRQQHFRLCPIRPNVIGHSSRHARHRKVSRDVAWAALSGIARAPRTRYPKRTFRHQHPPLRDYETTDSFLFEPPEYDLPLDVVARAVP